MRRTIRKLAWMASLTWVAGASAFAQESGFQSDFWKLVEDLDLAVKVFSNPDGETTYGFSYGIDRDILIGTVDVTFTARGNVAFEEQFNPQDFLETKLTAKYDWFRKLSDAQRTGDGDVILADMLHIDVNASVGLEADQDFTQKQYTYGGSLDLWAKISERKTAWWNPFDYPAAALRALSGYTDPDFQPEEGFYPKASFGLPVVSLGIDQVEVDENDPRAAAGDESDFARLRLETSLRSPVATFGAGDDTEEIFIGADYRYYKELNAADGVEAADLDSFDFVTLSLFDGRGLFVRYTSGKLPFDADDSQAYEVGWSFNGGDLLGKTPAD